MPFKEDQGMIPHITVTRLAGVYQKTTTRIRQLILELGEELEELKAAFSLTDALTSGFDIKLHCFGSSYGYDPNAEDVDRILREMKRHAWGTLIQKLDIMKIMSSKRQQELRNALYYGPSSRYGQPAPDEFPEITEENILSVLSGMVSSADEFIEEAILEEYDWLRPGVHWKDEYKTNRTDRIGRKVIKYCVERTWDKSWQPHHSYSSHLRAIDWIFHNLDGKAIPREHDGPLISAIRGSGRAGVGQTDYFKFKCYGNGNLHLEFRRQDLLDKFNQIAGNPTRVGAGK